MAQLGRFLILYHHQLLIDGPSTSNPYSLLLCVMPPSSSSDLIFRLFLFLFRTAVQSGSSYGRCT